LAAGQVNRDHLLLYPVLQEEQDFAVIPEGPGLSLDDPFLTLAGCYLADGSIGGRAGKAHQICFTFGGSEAELADEVHQILRSKGVSAGIRVRPEKNTRELIVHSMAWASLFAHLFGRGAGKKRLPTWMLTLPRDRQKILLRALWRCDGYVGEGRGYPRATYVTVSPALAYATHQMLLRQGIPARLSVRRPANRQRVFVVNVTSADALRCFSRALDIPVVLPQGRALRGRIAVDDQYLYLPVLGVRWIPYAGPVHNLDVERDHTFVASLSLVHNCIVNGPGEMADADYGYVGKAGGKIALYRGHEVVKESVPEERGVEELVALIKADGKWVDPPEGSRPAARPSPTQPTWGAASTRRRFPSPFANESISRGLPITSLRVSRRASSAHAFLDTARFVADLLAASYEHPVDDRLGHEAEDIMRIALTPSRDRTAGGRCRPPAPGRGSGRTRGVPTVWWMGVSYAATEALQRRLCHSSLDDQNICAILPTGGARGGSRMTSPPLSRARCPCTVQDMGAAHYQPNNQAAGARSESGAEGQSTAPDSLHVRKE
jgi:hypothetical protein